MNTHDLEYPTETPGRVAGGVRYENTPPEVTSPTLSSAKPVCVTGMHRSGTSMVANLLNLCGLYLGEEGDLIGPSAHNTRGYWENRKFLEINEEILSRGGGGWDMPPAARTDGARSDGYVSLQSRAEQCVLALRDHPAWGWKDPRTCLTIPFWKTLFPEIRVVVCVRSPLEVVSSLKKRGSTSRALGFHLWKTYNQRLLAEIPPERRIVTHYDTFFSNPQGELRRIVDYLGLPATNESIEQASRAVTTSCRNNRSPWSDFLKEDVPTDVADLYARLCADAGLLYDCLAEEEGRTFRKEPEDRMPSIEVELRERSARLDPGETLPVEEAVSALRQEPDSSKTLVELGEICFHYGLYDRAKLLFERALSSGREDCEALNNLGVLYFQLADFRTAKHFFMKALESKPDHGEAAFNLSQLPDIPETHRPEVGGDAKGVLSASRLDLLIGKYGYPFRVDLGCGVKPEPGYLGIDRLELDCVDIVCDVTKGIPLPDASVQEIRSIHFFEHLPGSSLHKVVREAYRVLVPGGSVYIRLPYYTHKTAFYASHLIYWNKDYFDSIFVKTNGFSDSRAQYMYSEEIRDKNNPFHQIFQTNPEWCRIHLWNVVKEIEYWCRKPEEPSDE